MPLKDPKDGKTYPKAKESSVASIDIKDSKTGKVDTFNATSRTRTDSDGKKERVTQAAVNIETEKGVRSVIGIRAKPGVKIHGSINNKNSDDPKDTTNYGIIVAEPSLYFKILDKLALIAVAIGGYVAGTKLGEHISANHFGVFKRYTKQVKACEKKVKELERELKSIVQQLQALEKKEMNPENKKKYHDLRVKYTKCKEEIRATMKELKFITREIKDMMHAKTDAEISKRKQSIEDRIDKAWKDIGGVQGEVKKVVKKESVTDPVDAFELFAESMYEACAHNLIDFESVCTLIDSAEVAMIEKVDHNCKVNEMKLSIYESCLSGKITESERDNLLMELESI